MQEFPCKLQVKKNRLCTLTKLRQKFRMSVYSQLVTDVAHLFGHIKASINKDKHSKFDKVLLLHDLRNDGRKNQLH